ncbi:hypothetical protein LC082_10580 [Microbacterium esteraromaticum]|uniref:outer membrane protein assembly factor BamB family protein n=1 Tax=Microbacterium esteraromaticum TaxID=57043 RepID=UPI001CD35F1F|nr:hypothetical protein [Microbacterium esteraromaticum]MCA1307345.1 hypothetical protein [Microbacterium esteraromaticum]
MRLRARAVLGALALLFAVAVVVSPLRIHSPAGAADGGDGLAVVNPSFEELGGDGAPLGWSNYYAHLDGVWSSSEERASAGTRSLHWKDDRTDLLGGLVADAIPIAPGSEYEFSIDYYLVSGDMRIHLMFEDVEGARVGNTGKAVVTTPGQWERSTVTATAPESAVTARLLLLSNHTARAEGYVDEVQFRLAPIRGVEEHLDVHVASANAQSTGLTTTADGRALALFGTDSSPVIFSAVDVSTGERVFEAEMDGAKMTWGYVVGDDGVTYIATATGGLWRFDPNSLELDQILQRPFGEMHLYSIDLHEDGRVFVGTYPSGKILSYDPADGRWEDHGGFGASYVQGLAVVGDTVFAGTRAPVGLWALDVATGTKSQVPLPAEYRDHSAIQALGYFGEDQLFVHMLTPSRDLLVYDLTRQWVDTIPNVANRRMAPPRIVPSPDGDRRELYYQDRATREVRGYDVDSGQIRSLGFTVVLNSMNWYWAAVDRDGFPGDSLVGTSQTGTVTIWNPLTGNVHHFVGDFVPSKASIRVLDDGPDGKIYMGGYATHSGMVRFDPARDESEVLAGPPQTERIGTNGDRLVVGGYGQAPVFDYDTSEAWEWGNNPLPRVYMEQSQDRVLAVEAVSPTVTALGSLPLAGEVGGALSFFDHTTRELQTHRNIVQDQSVMSLAYRDGLLYGGTSVQTGLGTQPTTAEALLFVYDLARGEIIDTVVPVPGQRNVSGLAFDADGRLWGMTGTTLFEFDTEERAVVARIVFDPRSDRADYFVGRDLKRVGDKLVGFSRCMLFEVDPATRSVQTLVQKSAPACFGLGVDGDGRYYYGADTEVYRWTPAGSGSVAPTPTPTPTAEPSTEPTVEPTAGPGPAVASLSAPSARAGAGVTITGTGFLPSERLTIELRPSGAANQYAIAGAEGALRVDFDVPAAVAAGQYDVVITRADQSSIELPLRVIAAAHRGDAALAMTGASMPVAIAGIAGLLVLAGAGLIRQRHRNSARRER